MNRKLKIILILYFLAIAIGFTLPFIFLCKDQLKWSLDIVRTISILSASLMALFYFDPFGIRKSNIVKQHDNVIAILECIVGQRLLVDSESDEPEHPSRSASQYFMSMKDLKEFNDTGNISDRVMFYKNFPIIFELENFIDGNEKLIALKNSIYTPSEIAQKMSFFEFHSASKSIKDPKKFSKVSWGNRIEKDNLFDTLNGEKIEFNEILKQYYLIINESIKWLEANSFSIAKLNLK